jgi:hypothetical protein
MAALKRQGLAPRTPAKAICDPGDDLHAAETVLR